MDSKKKAEEIIQAELMKAEEELGLIQDEDEYSSVSKMTENIKDETEKLVKEKKIPSRKIVDEISTAELAIDLAMANLAKQTALKLQKLEEFLGKIEDKLFRDDILEDMNKGDLLLLYTNTRMMRADAFRMIREIRKEVDFASLEANLLSLHAKESIKSDDDDDAMGSLLQSILSDDNFIEIVEEEQKKGLEIEED